MKNKLMRIPALLLTAAALLVLLTACGSVGDTTNQAENPTPADVADTEDVGDVKLTDVFPDLDTVTGVYVNAGTRSYQFEQFSPGGAYARADETQAKRIVELLRAIDMDEFEARDKRGIAGSLYQLRIENAEESRIVQVLCTSNGAEDWDTIYIVFPAYCEDGCLIGDSVEAIEQCQERILRETLCFEGPRGTFSDIFLHHACGAVLSDDTDLLNIGFVYKLDSDGRGGPEQVVKKGDCARARHILDGTIDYFGAYKITEDLTYDVVFVVSDTMYSIDTASGFFLRERGGEAVFCKVDEMWRDHLSHVLGVFEMQHASAYTPVGN